MAGLLGRIVGGAMQGYGTGLVQKAKIDYENAIRSLDRGDRKAEREEDNAYRTEEREEDKVFRKEERDSMRADRATERAADQVEREKDRAFRDKEREDEQAFRATEASRARAAATAAAREPGGSQSEKQDKRGKQLLEAAKDRFTSEDQYGVKKTDWEKVGIDLVRQGYDSRGTKLPSPPASRADVKVGTYMLPDGPAKWDGKRWVKFKGVEY